MSQPVWVTPAGSIGTFTCGTSINFLFLATSDVPGDVVTYTLLNGSFPKSLTLDSNGEFTGTIANSATEQIYNFTIRARNSAGVICDRTFSMDVYGIGSPSILTPNGVIVNTLDSVYVDFTIQVNDFSGLVPYEIIVSSGSLPTGLSMDRRGRITGYAAPPTLLDGSPTTTTYTFYVQMYSEYGITNGTFSIIVRNQLLTKSIHSINPVILNRYPLNLPLSLSDPYYAYYLLDGNNIGTIKSNEYFNYKIIGHDFEGDAITYSFSKLPPGLSGNPSTGWITGTPTINSNSISNYSFSVTVLKTNYPSVISNIQTFNITITNNVNETITWNTNSDLGTLLNGETSALYIDATAELPLSYSIVSGSLPSNLTMLSNGSIIGKVSYEPESVITPIDTTLEYTFTVKTFLTDFPIVYSTKEFTLKVDKKFFYPTENVYLKATPNLTGRAIINSLLDDTVIIPTEYLYRPEDVYFGKASEVRVVLTYGVRASNIETYLNILNTNFYNRKIVLGEIKTAQATDGNGNILYEVVYSEIVDDLITPNGVSIPDKIYWPRQISLGLGDYYTSNNNLYTSSTTVYTSETPGFTYELYPASIQNMRDKIITDIPYDNNQTLLPLWMISQQSDGNTLGFKQVWVICYTLPGKSQVILNNINSLWPHKLNEIDFSLDRFLVDKSATFNYNLLAGSPGWTDLPGASPTPDPLNTYDLPILFPRTNILPTSNQ